MNQNKKREHKVSPIEPSSPVSGLLKVRQLGEIKGGQPLRHTRLRCRLTCPPPPPPPRGDGFRGSAFGKASITEGLGQSSQWNSLDGGWPGLIGRLLGGIQARCWVGHNNFTSDFYIYLKHALFQIFLWSLPLVHQTPRTWRPIADFRPSFRTLFLATVSVALVSSLPLKTIPKKCHCLSFWLLHPHLYLPPLDPYGGLHLVGGLYSRGD